MDTLRLPTQIPPWRGDLHLRLDTAPTAANLHVRSRVSQHLSPRSQLRQAYRVIATPLPAWFSPGPAGLRQDPREDILPTGCLQTAKARATASEPAAAPPESTMLTGISLRGVALNHCADQRRSSTDEFISLH